MNLSQIFTAPNQLTLLRMVFVPTCRSTIWVSSLVDSASKTITSSSRFRNSGLNAARTAAITASRLAVSSPNAGSAMNCDPRFEVSTRMVFLKSTVRP